MKLDRESIVRSDFPAGRPGWSRAAVEAHLEQIADAVGEARLGSAGSEPASLSSHIQGILEAADAAATEIKAQAQAQAEKIREQVLAPAEEQRAEVASAARALVGRVEAIEAELAALFADLRTRGVAIGVSIAGLELEADVAASEQSSAMVVDEPAASPGGRPAAPPPEGEATDDLDAARLVALDMALSGDSRAEIDSYLAAHFALANQSALVDEVLAAASG